LGVPKVQEATWGHRECQKYKKLLGDIQKEREGRQKSAYLGTLDGDCDCEGIAEGFEGDFAGMESGCLEGDYDC
jgi:hypothetical protein